MNSFVYSISFSAVNAYAVQPDGRLEHIGVPIQDDAYSICACEDIVFVGGYGYFSIYRAERDGALTPLIENYAIENSAYSIAAMRVPGEQNYWFFVNDGAIKFYKFNYWLNSIEQIAQSKSAGFVTAIQPDPIGNFLYATIAGTEIDLASFRADNFALRPWDEIALPAGANTIVAVDPSSGSPTKKMLYTASTIDSSIVGYRMDIGKFFPLEKDTKIQLPGVPTAMQVSADGKNLFVATSRDSFRGDGESLAISYAIDRDTGGLNRLSALPCEQDTSVLTLAAGGKYLYVASNVDDDIYSYQIDGNGALTQKPTIQTGDINDAMAAVDILVYRNANG
jgi:6-phosphogluconolactonase (cycloisomerase 2 family)